MAGLAVESGAVDEFACWRCWWHLVGPAGEPVLLELHDQTLLDLSACLDHVADALPADDLVIAGLLDVHHVFLDILR